MSRQHGHGGDRFRQGPQSSSRQQPAPEGRPAAPAPPAAPRPAEATADAPVPSVDPPQPGWKRCKALRTCLVRGVAVFPPSEFWMDGDDAERLRSKGSLEFV